MNQELIQRLIKTIDLEHLRNRDELLKKWEKENPYHHEGNDLVAEIPDVNFWKLTNAYELGYEYTCMISNNQIVTKIKGCIPKNCQDCPCYNKCNK